jgi:beta-mannosidase
MKPVRAAVTNTDVSSDSLVGLLRSTPGFAVSDPNALARFPAPNTEPLVVSAFSTVAEALTSTGRIDPVSQDPHLDDKDWWWSVVIEASADGRWMTSDGFSVGAEVFVNGLLVHRSDSAWLPISIYLPADTTNVDICFRSMSAQLTALKSVDRAYRARWRTRLVETQQLRLVRTPLFGRMPGWNLPLPVIGSHGKLRFVEERVPELESVRVDLSPDGSALVDMVVLLDAVAQATTRIVLGGVEHGAYFVETRSDGRSRFRTVAHVPQVPLWWPHTHGEPNLVPLSVVCEGMTSPLPSLAFRNVVVDPGSYAPSAGPVSPSISVNGVKLFSRGVNWIPVDGSDPFAEDDRMESALRDLVAAGVNLIRVPGTTVYAPSRLYQRCTELGIMVWQDFMFANLDVPAEVPSMTRLIDAEVEVVASRIARFGAVVVLCGGSEVEQQAAMAGANTQVIESTLGRTLLAELAARRIPHVAYVASSPSASPNAGPSALPNATSVGNPTGQVTPHHPRSGFAHYFGVGAYRRSLSDARLSGVGFATECLAYAHVPSIDAVDRLMGDEGPLTHHPRWKRGVPRDRGAGWDFDDVRDSALREVFGVDPTELRWSDPASYLQLSRSALVEVFDATFSEWRRPGSICNGALVWTGRDLFEGAGWGLTEVDGTPKSAWFALARRCAPISVALTDEGLNGVDCHVFNDPAEPLEAMLHIGLYSGSTVVLEQQVPIVLSGHQSLTSSLNSLLNDHRDLNGAYAFGPAAHDLIRVKLTWASGTSSAHLWPAGRPSSPQRNDVVHVESVQNPNENDEWLLQVSSSTGAFAVSVEGAGWKPSTNWFHLAPGDQQLVTVRPIRTGPSRRISVRAISAPAAVSIALPIRGEAS